MELDYLKATFRDINNYPESLVHKVINQVKKGHGYSENSTITGKLAIRGQQRRKDTLINREKRKTYNLQGTQSF